jgi:hypothetical protein
VVNARINFAPDRRLGQLFNAGASALLTAGGAFGFWQASQAQASPAFLLYLAPTLLAIVLALVFLYRLQALSKAGYALERDGIRLKWGLRVEDIPMDQVLWVQTSSQYQGKLPLPFPFWPGAVLGKRKLSNGTPIEFLSADFRRMILIGTSDTVYAISPADPGEFLLAFKRLAELGSLTSIPAHSQLPSFLLARLWADVPARSLVLAGLLLSLLLLGGVVLAVPAREWILLRPAPTADLNAYVPAIRLLLLPVLSSTFYLINFLGGLYFFRQIDWDTPDADVLRTLSYVLFGSGMATPILFIGAVFHILLKN